jgi:hypothetical protein
MEHQLKLHSESLQMRIDELEKENTEIMNKNQTINEVSLKLIHFYFYRKIPS